MPPPTFCTHSELNEDSLAQHCGTGGGDGGESGGDGGAHAAAQPPGEKPFAYDFWQSSQLLPAQTALQLLEALRAAQFTKVASTQAQDAVSDGAEKAEQDRIFQLPKKSAARGIWH